jgi:DNA helicase-2/ATP-dependent DNA helicase PcrA
MDRECIITAMPAEVHYDGSEAKARPPLVIAGAGSGKTNTLAHRVAHLVISGVDPHRILLLTFTRRGAEEMIRRVKRITATALGTQQRPRRLTMARITSVPRSNG